MADIEKKEYLQETLKPIEPQEREKIVSEKTKTSNLEDDINILGGGNYAVGTGSRDSTTGTQAFIGVGFEPKMVIIKAVYAANPGGTSIGHATSTTDEGCIFTRPDGTVSYSTTDIIAAYGTDQNQATINSIDSDGFTLNWTASNDVVNFIYECFG